MKKGIGSLFNPSRHNQHNYVDVLGDDKGETEAPDTGAENYIYGLQDETERLCKKLDVKSDEFDPQVFFDEIYKYVDNDKRLIYFSITTYIFDSARKDDGKEKDKEKKEQEKRDIVGSIINNLRSVVDYSNGDEFRDNNKEKDEKTIDLTKKYLLKFWDHVHLAQRQYKQITKEEQYFEDLAKKSVENATKPIAEELNRELISLVGIFTALSFLVFGGVSSLDNVFSGAQDIPILKLLIVGSVWGLCMLNLIFIFLYFIAALSGISINSAKSENANIVKKYPIVIFTNWLLATLLAFSIWTFCWNELGLSGYVIKWWIFTLPTVLFYYYVIAIIAIIVFFIIMCAYCKKDPDETETYDSLDK